MSLSESVVLNFHAVERPSWPFQRSLFQGHVSKEHKYNESDSIGEK